jgi:hypothetical protein
MPDRAVSENLPGAKGESLLSGAPDFQHPVTKE